MSERWMDGFGAGVGLLLMGQLLGQGSYFWAAVAGASALHWTVKEWRRRRR